MQQLRGRDGAHPTAAALSFIKTALTQSVRGDLHVSTEVARMAWKLVPGRCASDAPSRRSTVPPEKGKKSLANQHVLPYLSPDACLAPCFKYRQHEAV
ncbi:hypothetical protein N7516_004681 [Penicillium verrucosum]|uniref:uncharacterized protein n=1 Tax=Penicillium verrucosum TaxID=60171 RepID=UPI0025454748|nr:uncharacterized protein N7516_004681 [Penicillium verrucosum]KAJ5944513.1 hypothetical protein N7516_004681 [Penicillium verrucosum]